MNDWEHLFEVASLGEAAKDFLKSKVGVYLQKRADECELAALRDLRKAPPGDQEVVAQLQVRAAAPPLAINWLLESIQQGDLAQFSIESLKAKPE